MEREQLIDLLNRADLVREELRQSCARYEQSLSDESRDEPVLEDQNGVQEND